MKHSISQLQAEKAGYKFKGIDLVRGKIVDMMKMGVLEPAISKVKSRDSRQKRPLQSCESMTISR